jgi:hypothetical protein
MRACCAGKIGVAGFAAGMFRGKDACWYLGDPNVGIVADGLVRIEAVGDGGACAENDGVEGGGGRLDVETEAVVGP